jgi:tetratricopeptide (TPR) repeat protein
MARRAGETIGPFEIIQFLGAGGSGEVYKVKRDDGAVFALKVLTSTAPETAERFMRELAATPAHPHIRPVYRASTEPDGTRWLEMAFLDGASLREVLDRRRLGWAEIVRLGAQVCDALEATHRLHVVHRDLKPENLFVDSDALRHVHVVDFSIARLQDAARLTRTGTVLGTFQYMSPEQVSGASEVDARSDLWSLGVILYECATGRTPFRAESLAGLVYDIAFRAPDPVSQHRPDIPGRLAQAIHRALVKAPSERFATARAFREALLATASHLGDTADPTTAPPGESPGEARALLSLVFLSDVRDLGVVRELSARYRGELVPFADRKALARFGGPSLHGDEPERAVRFARDVLSATAGVGVATGWALSVHHVEGSALAARAETLAAPGLVTLDAATAGSVRERLPLTELADGSATLPRDAPPPRPPERFFGRDAHVTALVESATTAALQGVTVVTVQGDPGLGKTRLFEESLTRVRRDGLAVTELQCRCTSYRQDIPLGAWRDILTNAERAGDFEVLDRQPSAAPEVLFDRAAVAVESALRALAEASTVIVAVDDAHWIDALSLRLFGWLIENAADIPLALWFSGRADRWSAALPLPQDTRRLTLDPLSPDDSAALVTSLIGEAPPTVLDRAGGNPLFLRELARLYGHGDAAHGDSASVADWIFGARLARLDPGPREFARRAAVIGRVGWVEAVQAMDGDPAAWRKLLAERVVQRSARSSIQGAQEFTFTSGLMTEVAYRLWPGSALATLHATVAEWLSARPDASPAELGRHWERALQRERAASAYVDATERAGRAGDVEKTIELTGRALELTSDTALRWRALAAQDSVLQLAAQEAQRELQEQGLELMRRLSLDMSLAHSVEVAWRQCYFYRIAGQRELALAFGDEALALIPALGDEAAEHRWASASHNELALLYADAGDLDAALGHAREAHGHAAYVNDPWWSARTRATEAYAIIELDRLEESLALLAAAAAGYAQSEDRRREAIARANQALALLRLGRFEEARAGLEEAIVLSRRVGNRRTAAVATLNLCTLRRLTDVRADLRPALDAVERDAQGLRFGRLVAAVRLERAWLALRDAVAPAETTDLARAAGEAADASRSPALIAQALTARLLAARAAGERDPAFEAEVRAKVARGLFAPEGAAALAAALARLTGEADDAAEAHARLGVFLDRAVERGDRAACARSFALRHALPEPSAA